MDYINIGKSGLKVSRFCLGTFNFFHVTGESEALQLLDKAEALGINFFDTANIYGKEKSCRGAAETLLGNWFQKDKGRRQRCVLSTKVYGPMGSGPNQSGLSAYHIHQACDDSLRRLNTDHIDIYQMHHYDPSVPWEEIWQAFEILILQGKVLYIGSSNFSAWQIMRAQHAADRKNLLGLISEQSIYNLKERTVELEVLPAIRELGMGFFPWSPLGGGVLAGSARNKSTGRRSLNHKREEVERISKTLKDYEEACIQIGAKPSHVALAWLLHNKAVTAPVIGPRNAEQLEDSLQALEIKLDQETLNKLDRIWPGPGEAPDAYTHWGQPR